MVCGVQKDVKVTGEETDAMDMCASVTLRKNRSAVHIADRSVSLFEFC